MVQRGRRDELAIYNERIKLRATTLNSMGLGFVGFSLIKPLIDDGPRSIGVTEAIWIVVGVALHYVARYILGMLKTEERDDDAL